MSLTRPLDAVEIRVLGALMEKEQTTPDAYPLTINALISACNQKTNREPVTALTETQVVEALDELRNDVLAWRIEGARAERWEHRLDRRWHLTPASKAIMTLLMLRGPQTPGELKTRSGRMHDFGSVEEVERVLGKLAEGGGDALSDDALVQELPRRPGQRESRWMHRVGTEEAYQPYAAETGPPPEETPVPEPSQARPAPRPAPEADRELQERVEGLEGKVADLEAELTALRRRLGDLDGEG